MTETKIVTITNPADWKEGDTAERVWPDGTTLRGVLRQSGSLGLRIGANLYVHARLFDGTVPTDGTTVTVTREVPDRVPPTEPGSLVLVFRLRGETLDPPVVALLDDCEEWNTATSVAGTHYHRPEHIEEWEPATVLPTEAVGRAKEIVTAALGHMESEDWTFITGDDLRTIRDALAGVQE